jgi:putative membrane protein
VTAPVGGPDAARAPRAAGPPRAAATGVDIASWRRLHPLSPVVRTGRALVPLLVVLLITLTPGGEDRTNTIWHLAAVALAAGAGVVSWLVTRWRVEDGTLRVESGLLRRQSQRVPLTQVQAVDIIRPGIARALGLAEVRLRTAAGSGDAGRLAYLRLDEAERVRAQLLALAHGVREDAPAPPELPVYQQDGGRLVASVVLSRGFGVLVAFGIAVGVTALFSTATAGSVAGAGFAYALGVGTVVWRRFNDGYGLRVAAAADGLRTRSGALETTAETIPRGRVQAVVVTRPLAWRPMGWCRLQLDVAGQVHGREERQSGTRQLRTVIAAGRLEDATPLLDLVLPGRPERLDPPPVRARWKSPLRYHWLGTSWNGTALVARGGRVTQRTVWVPLAKVQSLRLSQGPVQRWLRLSTLHVDAAGRRVTASLRDRDAAEAEQLLRALADACREARRPLHPVAAGPVPGGPAA